MKTQKVEEAKEILKALGMPQAQQNEISALTLLALAGIKPEDSWAVAERRSLTVTKGIMAFIEDSYGKQYAPNTRETFRRQVLHQFVQGNIAVYNPDDPSLATNSPRAHYAISEEARRVIRAFGSDAWDENKLDFLSKHGALQERYECRRRGKQVPIRLPDGSVLELSPGSHNLTQKAVVEEFGPRFASASVILYLGDTAKKDLMVSSMAKEIGIPMDEHGKLPDIIFYDVERERLLLIEVVTSHGPMTPKRVTELRNLLSRCEKALVFLSAFPSFAEFRKHLSGIAWETEVWIAEAPEHMIHFNGEHFW